MGYSLGYDTTAEDSRWFYCIIHDEAVAVPFHNAYVPARCTTLLGQWERLNAGCIFQWEWNGAFHTWEPPGDLRAL